MHVDLEPIRGVVLGQAADQCLPENRQGFVDDCDHNIDGGVAGEQCRQPFRRRPGLIGEETELAEAVEFGRVGDGSSDQAGRLIGRDHIQQAPEHVAGIEKEPEQEDPTTAAILFDQEANDEEHQTRHAESDRRAEVRCPRMSLEPPC